VRLTRTTAIKLQLLQRGLANSTRAKIPSDNNLIKQYFLTGVPWMDARGSAKTGRKCV